MQHGMNQSSQPGKRKGKSVAVKYYCPLCGRRFVEWGAEKMEFKCPTDVCKGGTLIPVGSSADELDDKPELKRTKKRKAAAAPTPPPALDIVEIDSAFIESDDVDDDEEEDEIEEEPDAPVVVPTEDDSGDDDGALLDDADVVDADDDDTFADALDIES